MRLAKIERNIPMPTLRVPSKYPFANMKVGDSFAIRKGQDVQLVRQAASHYSIKKNPKTRFAIYRTEEGYRCWRVK